jgi:hypothetical protein
VTGLIDTTGLSPGGGLSTTGGLDRFIGLGGSVASGYQLSFTSAAASYVGSASTVSTGGTASWLIEGTVYAGLNPGTVALTGNHQVQFGINPGSALTTLVISNNSLKGPSPDWSEFPNLTTLIMWGNQFTGSFPTLVFNQALTYVDMGLNAGLSGPLPSISGNLGMAIFQCGGCNFTGVNPSLAVNTALTGYALNNNNIIGSIHTLAPNTLLTFYNVATNFLTAVDVGFAVPAALKTIDMHNNLLPQASVDAVLAAVVAAGATAGTLNLGGTGNATPSAAGLADKATLITRTWTVTTN